jgi:hypothetical protein
MKSRLLGLAIWLGIATIAGAIGHFGFGANFWVVAGLAIMSLFVNGLVIEWEDRQPGGWGDPEHWKD